MNVIRPHQACFSVLIDDVVVSTHTKLRVIRALANKVWVIRRRMTIFAELMMAIIQI
jgi:hypothetical protein